MRSLIPNLQEKILAIRNSLRPGQQQMADWESGPLAISAVPGAGKSTGMVAAAIAQGLMLLVTLGKNFLVY
ncbi:MAG: hypothetical protein HWQ41_12605 [Nostoc sp. NOS(2021)]|uniref:hypothetical protein n=1 Tax=Nostoc sp. NOS(2021) TaxID=2815407 RepID=UPI0025ECC8AB|nr:hypothetical protein [Nostoc sp. NOS(2021)]MBN3896068.1 hypothetical protein [Nostoc sp. NOS(2021)]